MNRSEKESKPARNRDEEELSNRSVEISYETKHNVKVMLVKDGVAVKLFVINVPLLFNEDDIINSILPSDEIAKDELGYKHVEGQIERRVQVTLAKNQRVFQYALKLHSATAKVDPEPRRPTPESLVESSTTAGSVYQREDAFELPVMRLQNIDEFGTFWSSKKFSDVTLSVEGRDIHAHRIVLANRSPVFDAMLTRDMAEWRLNKFEITDIDYDTTCHLLQFIYIGEFIDDEESDAFEKYSKLLMAANKYRVDSLKEKCEEKLPSFLTTENVLDCVVLAESHNAVDMKKQAINFVVKNIEKIIDLPEYKNFVESHADISIEIVRALVVKKRTAESVAEEKKPKKNKK